MMGYWDDLSEVMDGKILALASADLGQDESEPDNTISLFSATRRAIGVAPKDDDCADVAFWEWREMRSLLVQVKESLDRAATRLSGRREIATVWVHQPAQSAFDVNELIAEGRSYSPLLPSLRVNRRPDAFLMVNAGKVDSSIASTVAVVVKNTTLPYGEIFQKLLNVGGKDEELLEFLDREVEGIGDDRSSCDQSAIPREFVRAKQKLRDDMALASLSVSSFLEILDTSNNLTNTNDDALLARLLHIAPEKNKSIAKRIEAMRLSAT
jgi:hypothetical protein